MSFCVALTGGGPADEDLVGGKARSLLRLAAAGLPVPPAFAVTTELFRALRPPPAGALTDGGALAVAADAAAALAAAPWPATFEADLGAALARLAPATRFSIRSSAALEDRADALGAGIFLSRTDVAARDVPAAVREVLAAALAPAAVAYAARRGLPADQLAMAVLLHPFTRGDASGTAAFDAATQDEPLVEVTPGAPGSLSAAARARIVEAARRLAARDGAVELEWVATGDAVLFLQARPYRPPERRAWSHATELDDGGPSRIWTWDAAHNPLPLSPAQAGLVAHVDARCRTAFRQRVVGGYLFYSPSETRPVAKTSATDALRAVAAAAERRLAALGAEPSLEEALEVFEQTYEPLYGVVQPAARAARDALEAFLREHARPETAADLLRGVPSLATERARRAGAIAATSDPEERAAAVAAYLAGFGDEAPVWDVAVPTYAEDARALERVGALRTPTPATHDAAPALPGAGAARLAAAREAAAVAEDDDVLYARVQSRVRQALVRAGRRLRAANLLARPEDVFWLPLESVRRDARGEEPLTLSAVTHAVAIAREAHAAALADPPPLAGARPGWDARVGGVRGRPASAGRAIGPAHLHAPGSDAPVPPGAILIARTLLPTELPLLAPAAIVVETGGVLGHVAAQARERRLPAVVDAAGAVSAFREGDRVLVDGDAGVAIRIGD